MPNLKIFVRINSYTLYYIAYSEASIVVPWQTIVDKLIRDLINMHNLYICIICTLHLVNVQFVHIMYNLSLHIDNAQFVMYNLHICTICTLHMVNWATPDAP